MLLDFLHLGYFGRSSSAPLTVDLVKGQSVAIDIAAHEDDAAASVKLGGYTVGQSAAGVFTIVDANGVAVFTGNAGSDAAGAQIATAVGLDRANAAYVEASLTSTDFHALTSERNFGAAALAAFVGGAGSPSAGELTALYARVNQVKADLLAHMAAVGTRIARGEHKAAETTIATTLTAIPAATTAGTACTLTIGLDAAAIAHANNAGKHFHDDSTLAGYSVSSNLLAGNATADKCRIEINALIVALLAHADGAVPN